MDNKFFKVTLTEKQFLSIIAALFAQMHRSPLFVEESLDVCSKLISSLVHSDFYKE